MRPISETYSFTRDAHANFTHGTVAVDAMSAISVWRALEGDRSFKVRQDPASSAFTAELTCTSEDLPASRHDLLELCASRGVALTLIALP